MPTEITLSQMPLFKKAYKKLHNNQKIAVDDAIAEIKKNPYMGEEKKGDLKGIFVHKFDCINQLFLLAYAFDEIRGTLICLGVHENFYRNLKNYRKEI